MGNNIQQQQVAKLYIIIKKARERKKIKSFFIVITNPAEK